MLTHFRGRRPAILLAFVAFPLLAACGKHEGNEAASVEHAPPDAAQQARDDAASTARCADHPLAHAMPPRDTMAGLPFRLWDCTPASFRAVYGQDGGKQVEISITDTRPADTGASAGAEDLNRRTRDMQRSVTRSSIEMLTRMADPMRTNAESLGTLGGPAYAPVLVPTSTSASFVIYVSAQTERGPAEAVALFNDRQVVTLHAVEHGSAVTGLTTPQAQALYLPFIQSFHPERLPQ
ncbi:hypothetical protein ACN9MB_06660 [Dyella kyungheensis]|jgi:hypothetical protein|uniref:hypothetical protein n=1 Tax=Dyella kyungheensis TaxID=1242174 RepID=UPI003CEF29FB